MQHVYHVRKCISCECVFSNDRNRKFLPFARFWTMDIFNCFFFRFVWFYFVILFSARSFVFYFEIRAQFSFRQTWYCIISNWYSNLFRLFYVFLFLFLLLSASFSGFNWGFRAYKMYSFIIVLRVQAIIL